jgi:beta-glucuronidase
VYWGIDFENPSTFEHARGQLGSLVERDKNRASVIIWSVGNETPNTEARLEFLKALRESLLRIDSTRLVSAALDRDENDYAADLRKEVRITDPFAAYTDILGCNEYLGWYSGTPDQMHGVRWDLPPDKPFFVSEFGADALAGHRGDRMERWTEDFQNYLYEQQIDMLSQIPSLRGMSPWILFDFRSPRRTLARIQNGWNRKGLISDNGVKKLAFATLKAFYAQMAKAWPDT